MRVGIVVTIWPHSSVPIPKSRHHNHCSRVKAFVLNAILPYWTMNTWSEKKRSVIRNPRLEVICREKSSKSHLRQGSANPNGVEDGVGKYSLEDVSLAMNFSGVEFVEQRHHDKRIENNGEVLSGPATMIDSISARGNVEHYVSCKRETLK